MSSSSVVTSSVTGRSATGRFDLGGLNSWRTPAVIVVCGCLISMIGFGPRATLGFFLTPMSNANGWGREVFALSVAVQTLLYGAAQPFSGAIADRFGTIRVII